MSEKQYNRKPPEDREERYPRTPGGDKKDRTAERGRRQQEQLDAARKRDLYMIAGFIGVLLIAVVLILIVTRDTRKEIMKTSEAEKEQTDAELPDEETVIDVAGKNPEPSREDTGDAGTPRETEEEQNLPVTGEENEAAVSEATEPVLPDTEPVTTETEPVPETPEAAPEETPAAPPPPEAPIPVASSVNVSGQVVIPSWIIQDFLDISPRNRSGQPMPVVHDIVIHWVANPGTTAKGNRDYFNDLAIPEANLEDISASAHFVVGLEGEVIQCIPLEEMAYANYPRNGDTISIEVCNPDWSGKYSDITYASVIKLAAYLCQQYGLNADHIIRHHDVSGKDCPKYYVEHPEAWEQLKHDVTVYLSQHPDMLREFP